MKNILLAASLLLTTVLLAGWFWQIPKKVQTHALEVVDSKGRVRMVATVDSLDRPIILLLDSTGRTKGEFR